MPKCFFCNTEFNNNHNLQQHLNTHGLTAQQLHLRLAAANALAASRRSAIPVTHASSSQRNRSDNLRGDSLETLLTTNADSPPTFSTENYDDPTHQDDFNDDEEINNDLDGDSENNSQSGSPPIIPDYVLDVNEIPRHLFGEEEEEEEEEVKCGSSSSSSSDESDAPVNPLPRVTRASNKKAVPSTVQGSSPDAISSPENMTTELF